jgi:hypothetical protein
MLGKTNIEEDMDNLNGFIHQHPRLAQIYGKTMDSKFMSFFFDGCIAGAREFIIQDIF